MEELQAAMQGGGAPPAPSVQDLSNHMQDPSSITDHIGELFTQYAGADMKLQLHELQCLAASVAAKLGINPASFGDLTYLYKRFDFDKDGGLDLNETTALVRTMMQHHHHEQHCASTGQTSEGFAAGDEVQYRNGQPVEWMDCTVKDVRGDGAIQISLFPMYLHHSLAKQKLRKKHQAAAPSTGYKIQNELAPVNDYFFQGMSGEVRMIVMWNNYSWPPLARPFGQWGPLDTHHGGQIMTTLAQACGVKDITEIKNEQCEPQRVVDTIFQVGQRCAPNDTFVFYYTGHGDSLPDQDGDEIDGTDEALCTVINGQCGQWTYLRDDDFSNALGTYVKATNVICVMDCCHSGTITDLDKPCWNGKKAVQISGCRDSEESVATGFGGLMTRALATGAKGLTGRTGSCAHVYNQALHHAKPLQIQFPHPSGRPQNITLQSNAGVDPNQVTFPLIPGLARTVGSQEILDKLQAEIDDFSPLSA